MRLNSPRQCLCPPKLDETSSLIVLQKLVDTDIKPDNVYEMKIIRDTLVVTTRFLDSHNDMIQLYVTAPHRGVLLISDGNETFYEYEDRDNLEHFFGCEKTPEFLRFAPKSYDSTELFCFVKINNFVNVLQDFAVHVCHLLNCEFC